MSDLWSVILNNNDSQAIESITVTYTGYTWMSTVSVDESNRTLEVGYRVLDSATQFEVSKTIVPELAYVSE